MKEIIRTHNHMRHNPVNLSICNQKGGVGKSTFTVLLASWLHHILGRNVLVVDCDYPQWSIAAQRDRELAVLEHSDYYKLLMVRQFRQAQRKIWPIVKSNVESAAANVQQALEQYDADIILYDLPGTVATDGVIGVLSSLDYLFVPMKADKVVMESTLSFANILHRTAVQNPKVPLQRVSLFWTMIDRRERTPLYDQYEKAINHLGIPLLETQIPYRSKFNKELLVDCEGVGRSTLLAAERTFAHDAKIDCLAKEILSIITEHDG